MEKRGQISLEYMAVVGITTFVAISLLVIANYYSRHIGGTIDTAQVDGIVKEVVDTAQSVYYFGEPANGTVTVTVKLWYRYAFKELAEQKNWTTEDILVRQESVEVQPP